MAGEFFALGDFYRIDDRTGFKVKASKTSKEWNGLIVSSRVFETRHPQDFVKGAVDNQNVPDPRPRQANTFLGFLETFVTATVAAAGTSIPVQSSARMTVGDTLNIMLDNGAMHVCTISTIPDAVTVTISPALPSSTSANLVVNDLSAVSSPSIG